MIMKDNKKTSIFIIKASPSKEGVGDYIMKKIVETLDDSSYGTNVIVYDQSYEYENLKYKQNSLHHFLYENTKEQTLFEKNIMGSEAIILICPVYFRHMPGEFKLTLDSFSYRSHEFPLIGKRVVLFTYCASNGAYELTDYFKMIFSSLGADIISTQSYYISNGILQEELSRLKQNISKMLDQIEKNIYRVTSKQEKLFQYYKDIVNDELQKGVVTSKHKRWKELLNYESLCVYIEKNLLE